MNELLSIQYLLIGHGSILDAGVCQLWTDYSQFDREILRNNNKFRFPMNILYEGSLMDCSICLESIEKGCRVINLDCSHVYHRDCIYGWKQNSCPYCRERIDKTAEIIMRLNSDID